MTEKAEPQPFTVAWFDLQIAGVTQAMRDGQMKYDSAKLAVSALHDDQIRHQTTVGNLQQMRDMAIAAETPDDPPKGE